MLWIPEGLPCEPKASSLVGVNRCGKAGAILKSLIPCAECCISFGPEKSKAKPTAQTTRTTLALPAYSQTRLGAFAQISMRITRWTSFYVPVPVLKTTRRPPRRDSLDQRAEYYALSMSASAASYCRHMSRLVQDSAIVTSSHTIPFFRSCTRELRRCSGYVGTYVQQYWWFLLRCRTNASDAHYIST